MKPVSFLIVCVLALCATITSAQTNSVLLKDGTGSLISQHNSIANAYAAIPAILSQAYIIELDTSYKATNETFPVTFTEKTGASSSKTITVTTSNAALSKRIDIIVPPTAPQAFILDNADWVIFDGKVANYNGGWRIQSATTVVSFINGASNNVLRRCYFSSTAWQGTSILFGTSPSNATGNSNNTVEYCSLTGFKKIIASEGTDANPNRNLVIQKNSFGPNHIAFKAASGTGKTVIDSNVVGIWSNDTLGYSIFTIDSLADTVLITRNIITMQAGNAPTHMTAPTRGIHIKAAGNANYAAIANNIIYNTAMVWVSLDDTSLIWSTDKRGNMVGIEFAGTAPIRADVYHNTIVFDGLLDTTAGTPFQLASAAILKTETSSTSLYKIKNNIFFNTRQGGVDNAVHATVALNDANTVDINYNIYNNANGQLAYIGAVSYSSLTAYKALFTNGNEAQSDSLSISFMSDDDYHLNSTMYGNTALYGTPILGFGTDIENHPRTNYYIGADEYVISCSAPPQKPRIYAYPNYTCKRSFRKLQTYGGSGGNGIDHQWQIRPAGSNAPFMDMPDGKSANAFHRFTSRVEIRLKDSCLAGGTVAYSDTLNMESREPYADSIETTQLDSATIRFHLAGPKHADLIGWDFGNGFGDSKDSVKHRFLYPGTYTVMVSMRSVYCGYDTLWKTVTVNFDTTTSLPSIQHAASSIRIYPNPTNTILMAEVADHTPYTITDLTGRTIQSGAVISKTIRLEQLPAGNYIISFTMPNAPIRYNRFIKQ